MISADCHAAPKLDDARGYIDAEHIHAFDAWRKGLVNRGDGLFDRFWLVTDVGRSAPLIRLTAPSRG